MKWRKLLSIKHGSIMIRNMWQYVISSQVSWGDKLLFLIPVFVYWVWPLDLLPGLPIDDIGVTILLMGWFTTRMTRKYPNIKVR